MPQDWFETENDLLVALKAGNHRAFEPDNALFKGIFMRYFENSYLCRS